MIAVTNARKGGRAICLFARIVEYLDRPVEVDKSARPAAVDLAGVTGRVTFAGVSFTYPGADRPALTDINLDVPAGSTLALCTSSDVRLQENQVEGCCSACQIQCGRSILIARCTAYCGLAVVHGQFRRRRPACVLPGTTRRRACRWPHGVAPDRAVARRPHFWRPGRSHAR